MTEGTWALDYSLFDDAACTRPLVEVSIAGPYRLEQKSVASPGAWEGTFGFARKVVTPHSASMAERLTRAECGLTPWMVGKGQDVLENGCELLGQYAKTRCAADHDLVSIEGDTLRFGKRPGDNDLCTPDRRPTALASSGARLTQRPVRHADTPRVIHASHIADLTHTLTSKFPFIPVPGITFPFGLEPIATIERDGVAANRWTLHEHLGTQIDAPSHFVPNGLGLEAIPVEDLIVPLVVIDIRQRASAHADTEVGIEDLRAWESKHGPIPDNAAVFMYSGWEERVADPSAYLNADGSNTLHFPGFSAEAARFLLNERNVAGIGVDTISIDPGRDHRFNTHKTWLAGRKWAVECVANLGRVPPVGATVFVGAVKVGGATGGPVRLIATW